MSKVSLINGHIDEPKQTNYDRIRNMGVDKMSVFLIEWSIECLKGNPKLNIKQWLESEVDTE